jgi:hypothetical protein
MRFVSTLVAISALVCMGASSPAPAAVVNVKREVKIADDGVWMVLVKIWYADGSWGFGFYRWSGVQSQINWANVTIVAHQGNGGGLQPEPRLMLIGSRIEIVGTPILYVP